MLPVDAWCSESHTHPSGIRVRTQADGDHVTLQVQATDLIVHSLSRKQPSSKTPSEKALRSSLFCLTRILVRVSIHPTPPSSSRSDSIGTRPRCRRCTGSSSLSLPSPEPSET